MTHERLALIRDLETWLLGQPRPSVGVEAAIDALLHVAANCIGVDPQCRSEADVARACVARFQPLLLDALEAYRRGPRPPGLTLQQALNLAREPRP